MSGAAGITTKAHALCLNATPEAISLHRFNVVTTNNYKAVANIAASRVGVKNQALTTMAANKNHPKRCPPSSRDPLLYTFHDGSHSRFRAITPPLYTAGY